MNRWLFPFRPLTLPAARWRWIGALGLVLILAACRPTPAVTPSPTPTATPPAVATSTPASTPAATSVPTPTATPASPTSQIGSVDPVVTDAGRLTVRQVTSVASGWVVLLDPAADADSPPLAVAPAAAGTSDAITLVVDPLQLPESVRLALYRDLGNLGQFEPGVDTPALWQGSPVALEAQLDIQVTLPVVIVNDQAVDESGLITLDTVNLPFDGWVAIHNDDEGAPGERLAFIFVPAGDNRFLNLTLPWRQATPRLHALVHHDSDPPEQFDAPAGDPLAMVRNQPLQASFQASYPPDILVLSQPIVDNQIVVERLISEGPGWVAASFQNEDGSLGNIIGFAALADGVNQQVSIPVLTDLATPQLYLQLHRDTGDIGEFGFPGTDPVVLYQGRQRLFTLDLEAGPYLITRDQTPQVAAGEATVIIPYVVTDAPVWVVLRADAEGAPGAVLGAVYAAPGVSRDLPIVFDPAAATPTVHAVLHFDSGEANVFEFEEDTNLDAELLRNRQLIDAPFTLLAAEAGP